MGQFAEHGDAGCEPAAARREPSSRGRESIAPLVEPAFWKSLNERFDVVIQPLAADGEQKTTNLYDPLAQAPQKFKNLRAVVLASDGDWNEGKPPVEAASAAAEGRAGVRRAGGQPLAAARCGAA